MDLHKISTKFEGQGHRSRVKVAMLKKVTLEFMMVVTLHIHFVMTYDPVKGHKMSGRDKT